MPKRAISEPFDHVNMTETARPQLHDLKGPMNLMKFPVIQIQLYVDFRLLGAEFVIIVIVIVNVSSGL